MTVGGFMFNYKINGLFIFIVLFFLYINQTIASHSPPWDQGHQGSRGGPTDEGGNGGGGGGETPCKPPCKPDPCSQGSPIYLKDGNFLYSNKDLFIPGRIPFDITRSYNSRDNTREGYLGYGWTFTYSYQLIETDDGSAVILIPNGQRHEFKFDNDSKSYIPPPRVYSVLTKHNDSFILQQRNGINITFELSGKLISIHDKNNNSLKFDYDTNGLSVITDDTGRELKFEYDVNGKIASITDFTGRIFFYEYDSFGNLKKYTNPMGFEKVYEYDKNHNMISAIDFEGDELLSLTYDKSSGKVHTYTDEYGEKWVYSYISTTEVHKTDSIGNKWKYILDDRGLIVKETDPFGFFICREYNKEGELLVETNKNGYTTLFAYDDNGNIIKTTDAYNNEISYSYHTLYNLVTTNTDPYGNQTVFEYDSKGNLKKIIKPLNHIMSFEHNSYGNIISITDANTNIKYFEYNIHGYLTKTIDSLGNNTIFEYDNIGNLIKVTDAEGNIKKYKYDKLNRIIEKEDTLGHKIQYSYDKNAYLTEIIDKNGNKTTFEKIINSNTSRTEIITNALGNTTTLKYEKKNLKSIVDTNGNITSYEYDALNQISKICYPDGSTETYSYDAVGNISSKINRNNDKTIYNYDALNRLIKKVFIDNDNQISYTYDALNLISVIQDNYSITYKYDQLNRIIQAKQGGKTIGYEYDAIGNKIKLIYPDRTQVSYIYNSMNKLSQIKDNDGQILISYTYNKVLKIKRISLQNNIVSEYQYDQINRLDSLVHNYSFQQKEVSNFTYDNMNNIKIMSINQESHLYNYDKMNQLINIDYPDNYPFLDNTFNFDTLGNRINTVSNNIMYTTNELNQYVKVDNIKYEYDLNGNLTNNGFNRYLYDYENQLIKVIKNTENISFSYDYLGRRISKTTNKGNYNYIYDGNQLISVYDEHGMLIKQFINCLNIDKPVIMKKGTNKYYYHFDSIGSVTALTDSNGNIIERYSYDVYGNFVIKDEQNNRLTNSKIDNPYYFTGRKYDFETGIYYYRMRYYDPTIGRFLQIDPISNNNTNLYIYCLNNPVNFIDPFGLKSDPCDNESWWEKFIPDAITISLSGSAFKWLGGGGGVEAVYIFGKGWVIYGQAGLGLGTPGGGIAIEAGPVWNLNDPSEYTGHFVEVQGSAGLVSGSGFLWPGGPGGVKGGVSFGTPGAAVLYEHYWIIKDFTKNKGK